ncbi:hypothetical protein EXIGLDRAFT_562848, partial [Exidia glandulosa HHB12029]
LDDTNYHAWSYRMEMRLTKMDLWEIVSGEEEAPQSSPNHPTMKKFRKRQRAARAEIVLCVTESQHVHTKLDDPHEIWENLRLVHAPRGLGTRMTLRRQLYKMAYSEFLGMSAWVTSVQETVRRITDL